MKNLKAAVHKAMMFLLTALILGVASVIWILNMFFNFIRGKIKK